MIAHSHPMYRSYPITVENIEVSEKDIDVMKQFPFRVWKESCAYDETKYLHLNIPLLRIHPVAIVNFNDENVLNLLFPILSSDPKSKQTFLISNISLLCYKYSLFCILDYGKKKEARIWDQIIFPYTKIESSDSIWNVIPIQVMAVLRDQNIIKKPKRPNLNTNWSSLVK